MQSEVIDDILDFAIEREQEAVDFYVGLAARAKGPGMREAFEQFAREEKGHKSRLARIKEKGIAAEMVQSKVLDLKLADYVVADEPNPDMDYQSALILAMQREKAAFRLYSDLAAATDDPELKKVMLNLAQEEAKHKLRFEVEYDEHFLADN